MKQPSFLISLFPLLTLIILLIIGVQLFGEDLTSGPSQIALLIATTVGVTIGLTKLNLSWEEIEEGITDNLKKTGGAIFILIMVGAITASWMLSGVVPTLIYYGLKIIHPSIFLFLIFIITGIVSLMAGSSWTTIGTIGIAMLSAGQILGFSSGWLAGAIISGAYFGDKISPLSDTTNLASSISGVPLYTHIKYLLITNIPSFILSGIIFLIVGFSISSSANLDVNSTVETLKGAFNISGWLLLIPAFTIFLIYKKLSPFLVLFISAITGAIVALLAQPQIIAQISPYPLDSMATFIYAPIKLLSSSVTIETGDEMLNRLSSTNGMFGMMNTIWLILCVCAFGGIMESCKFIEVITAKFAHLMRGTFSIVTSTIGASIFCNITLSDQYMSIILPSKMFGDIYKKRGYEARLLSRSVEDSATVTSVLVPWNTCGVAQSAVLGIPTLVYLPYCIFNLISPIISIVISSIGYKIYRTNKGEKNK